MLDQWFDYWVNMWLFAIYSPYRAIGEAANHGAL